MLSFWIGSLPEQVPSLQDFGRGEGIAEQQLCAGSVGSAAARMSLVTPSSSAPAPRKQDPGTDSL